MLGVLRKNLHENRIAHSDLLQKRLDSLRIGLHQLADRLNLRMILNRCDVYVSSSIDRHGDTLSATLRLLRLRLLLLLCKLLKQLVIDLEICMRHELGTDSGSVPHAVELEEVG